MIIPAAPKKFGRAARPFGMNRSEQSKYIGGAPSRALSPRGCQSGRTLLEMLAVLAIVGILSVAALAGLSWAMAKYRANNTMHDVTLWTFAALDSNQLYDMSSGQLLLPELGSVSTHGYPMAVWIQDKDVFTVHVNDVPKRVCSLMLDMIDENQAVTVNDIRYDTSDICTNDTNMLVFYMNKDWSNVGNICIPSCADGETCCGGECRTIQTPCGADGCMDCGSDYCTTSNTCCPTSTATKCGDNDCCDTKCCHGICCAESYMTCDTTTTCGCPNNMIPDPDTGACKCPDEAPYMWKDEEGTPQACCAAGYIFSQNVCSRLTCNYEGGNCTLNGTQCGTACTNISDPDAFQCSSGFCSSLWCPKGWHFAKPNYYGMNKYICEKESDPLCTQIRLSGSYVRWARFPDGKTYSCCTANADCQCTKGVCDASICTDLGGTYVNLSQLGYCSFEHAGDTVNCTQTGSAWECAFSNGVICATDCTDPPSCNGQCDTLKCWSSFTYDADTGMCQKDNVYCDKPNDYIACYLKVDDALKRCGSVCTSPPVCSNGMCTDICPIGWTFGYSSRTDTFGCHKDNILMYKTSGVGKVTALADGTICAEQCDLSTGNLKDCAILLGEACREADDDRCLTSTNGIDMTVTSCRCTGKETVVGDKTYCCPAEHTYVNGGCVII